MTREIGRVEKIEEGWMTIKIPTGDNCEFCSSTSSCSFQGPDSGYRFLKVFHESWIAEGDRVTLDVPESAGNISTQVAFVLPLILIVGGIALASYLQHSSYWVAIGGLAGGIVYLVTLFLVNKWVARSPRFRARILAVDKSQSEDSCHQTVKKEGLFQS